MNRKAILLIIAITFGISWLSAGLQYFAGIPYGNALSVLLTATTVMTAPALTAFIVRKWLVPGDFFSYGWRLKRSDRKGWLLTPLLFIAFALLAVGGMALAGNVLHLQGFGTVDMSTAHIRAQIDALLAANPGSRGMTLPAVPSGWVILLLSIVGGIIGGGTVNLLFCFGEELGWRGGLQYETRGWGFWKANLFIGIVWGFWHAPLILQGHNYPGHPWSGVFMMVLFCTGLAFVLGYIRIRSKSVVACAWFHGMINGAANGLVLLNKDGNPLYGIAGLSGAAAALLIIAVIAWADGKTIRQHAAILSERADAV